MALRIFPESYFLNANELPKDPATKAILITDRLKEAREILSRGGAVWIAGDGQTGQVRKSVTKYGHQFPFRAGAADLSLQTGAPLILAFPNLRDDGIIEVEFLPPLMPVQVISRQARIDSLLQQYADIYVNRWPQMLPNMTALWQRLRLADTAHNEMK